MYERIENIRDLIVKHILNKISPEENEQLQKWISASANNRRLFEQLTSLPSLYEKLNDCDRYVLERDELWNQVEENYESGTHKRLFFIKGRGSWLKYAVAAAVIVFITIGGYFYLNKEKPQQVVTTPVIKDIPPAGNKATLTLSNGSQIVLDNAGNGMLAQQGATTVLKRQDGELIYNAGKPAASADPMPAYNTVTTPRGGKYQLILPDGSKVWLNAASSLRFPVRFTGKERKVELNGQAYFEIVHSNSPFLVEKEDMRITVLGTRFDVNAYDEENVTKVTLLEGSVKVTSPAAQKATFIKPGQQAVLSRANDITVVNKEEPDAAIAWIHGRFSFDNVRFDVMMRELSRWYDVQVAYEGAVPSRSIIGEVDRTIPLSELLATLEKMGNTHFKIEGRTVRVIP